MINNVHNGVNTMSKLSGIRLRTHFSTCASTQTPIIAARTPPRPARRIAFKGASSLISINWNKIQTIGHYSFSNCIGLKSIRLGNDVEIINPNAASKSYPQFYDHYEKMTKE